MQIPSTTYDAFLLISFGGPEGMDDVLPFLNNVLKGKNVPQERLLSVAHHYELFNGVSPINEQNRRLILALKPIIEFDGPKLPIYWGNRNWQPMIENTVKQMMDDGVKRAIAFATAGYSSYSSCRQYIENIADACSILGANAPHIDKIRPFYNHPDFIATNADHLVLALDTLPKQSQQEAQIVFTAHSIPESMAVGCSYAMQLKETAQLIISEAKLKNKWHMAYQSRSGSPSQAWLEPDIKECIKEIGKYSGRNIVIAPIGFVSDHIEVLYDLDIEAKQLCDEFGIGYLRAKTAGTHPKFVSMIKKLVDEMLVKASVQGDKNKLITNKEFCFSACCPKG